MPFRKRRNIKPSGVILIQVDGLAFRDFGEMTDRKKLPFLKHLLDAQKYKAYTFYSGIPSTTPAVQAELFYGVRSAIPAFRFIRRESGDVFTMWDAVSAFNMAEAFREVAAAPLLSGGRSYGNIYSGGAARARYCAETLLIEPPEGEHPFRKFLFILHHTPTLARIGRLAVMELGSGAADFAKGILEGWDPIKEFKFIFTRLGLIVGLREWIAMRLRRDIAEGVPIIHANFAGYDEQAHRRGPDSPLTRRAAGGIDKTIRRIFQAARSSPARDYRLIVYSDHGQENSRSFEKIYGKAFDEAVREVFASGPLASREVEKLDQQTRYNNLYQRARTFFAKDRKSRERIASINREAIQVTAMGPFGHIYLPMRLSDDELLTYAERLVREAHVPLVLHQRKGRRVGTNHRGIFDLLREPKEVLGSGHPLLERVAEDLEAICRNPDSGDILVSGWDPEDRPLTFSVENGSHGGPGADETRGFVLLPAGLDPGNPVLRPLDLRRIVLNLIRNNAESL